MIMGEFQYFCKNIRIIQYKQALQLVLLCIIIIILLELLYNLFSSTYVFCTLVRISKNLFENNRLVYVIVVNRGKL